MLPPTFIKNDKKATKLIWVISAIVFIAVVFLSQFKFNFSIGFNPHVFAQINALINSTVAFLLIAAIVAIKQENYLLHKKIMLAAIVMSVLFLLSYIAHHLLAGETKFGDINHDGIINASEKLQVGAVRFIYYTLLLTHIPLAAIILPFILFTAYRSLVGEYEQHKKLARITWPIWLYVAVSGVIIYWMISPYYA